MILACLFLFGIAAFELELQRSVTSRPLRLSNKLNARLKQSLEGIQHVQIELWYYTCDVYIGTPPKKFKTSLDFWDSCLWLQDVGCEDCKERNSYDASESSTAVETDRKLFPLSEGRVVLDSMAFFPDGESVSNLPILALAEDWDSEGGIVRITQGLSPVSAYSKVPSFLSYLKQRKFIPEALFAINLHHWEEDLKGLTSPPTISFGMYETKGHSEFVFLNSTSESEWSVELTGFSVAGRTWKGVGNASFDVGLDAISLPKEVLSHIHEVVCRKSTCFDDEGGFFTVSPCSREEFAAFPDIDYQLGGHTFTASAQDYVEFLDGSCLFWTIEDEDWSFVTLGNTLMRSYYTVFDTERKVIGLAQETTHASSKLQAWSVPAESRAGCGTWLRVAFLLMTILLVFSRRFVMKTPAQNLNEPLLSGESQAS